MNPGRVRPAKSGPGKPKLLDRVREAIRVRGYSLRTEEAYVGWTKRFIIFHGKRHPLDMGAREVEAFLSHLATNCNVAASTQNQDSRCSIESSNECESSSGRVATS